MTALLRRLVAPIVVFLAALAVLAATNLYRPLDYAVYRTLALDRADTLALGEGFRLIDLPYTDALDRTGDPTLLRARLADLLTRIAADPANLPRAVVLDLWFSKDDRGLAPLEAALAQLERLKVPVYASFNPDAEGRTDLDALMREHAAPIYERHLAGYGHTRMQAYRGVLSYPRELAFRTADGTRLLRALPSVVARDLRWPGAQEGGALVVPLGAERSVDERTVAFVHEGEAATGGRYATRAVGGSALAAPPALRDEVVVVGSLAKDVSPYATQAGPKVLAWALADASQGHRNARVPLDQPALVAALIGATALVTAAAVALLFKFVTSLQTRPALLAAAGVAVGVAAFVAASAAGLALGVVLPAGLPLIGIGITGVLAWQHARKFLASGAAEGAGRYDVFISYSRKHGEWVASQLVAPLLALRGPDGRPPRVFFDRAEIGIGEAFTSKYMWAIVDSRVFVPVFSADYYGKAHCRNEMDLAYKRHVDRRLRLAPIAIEPNAVPEIYSVLNTIDTTRHPDFIDHIGRALWGEPVREATP